MDVGSCSFPWSPRENSAWGQPSFPGWRDGNGECLRWTELPARRRRLIKLRVYDPGLQPASEALGKALTSTVLLGGGTYLYFFGGGLLSSPGGFRGGGGDARGAAGLQVTEAAQVLFAQCQQLL